MTAGVLGRPGPDRRRTIGLVAAFAAIYGIWGSTYLAIDVAVDSIPPLLMIGTRCLVAGGLVYAYARVRGAPRPTRQDWVSAAWAGGLLFVGGQGVVAWAVQRVPSGAAALLNATIPMFAALLGWRGGRLAGGRQAEPIRRGAVGGLVLGLAGVALTMGLGGPGGIDPVGALALLVASLSWAAGAYRAGASTWPVRSVGAQLIAGGLMLFAAGAITGETTMLDVPHVAPEAWLALLYLIVFGSLVGYSAFVWLLGATAPSRVASHAYVNPVVAVLLGVGIAGEALTPGIVIGAVLIVFAVGLIVATGGRNDRKAVEGRDARGGRRTVPAVPAGNGREGRAGNAGQSRRVRPAPCHG